MLILDFRGALKWLTEKLTTILASMLAWWSTLPPGFVASSGARELVLIDGLRITCGGCMCAHVWIIGTSMTIPKTRVQFNFKNTSPKTIPSTCVVMHINTFLFGAMETQALSLSIALNPWTRRNYRKLQPLLQLTKQLTSVDQEKQEKRPMIWIPNQTERKSFEETKYIARTSGIALGDGSCITDLVLVCSGAQ